MTSDETRPTNKPCHHRVVRQFGVWPIDGFRLPSPVLDHITVLDVSRNLYQFLGAIPLQWPMPSAGSWFFWEDINPFRLAQTDSFEGKPRENRSMRLPSTEHSAFALRGGSVVCRHDASLQMSSRTSAIARVRRVHTCGAKRERRATSGGPTRRAPLSSVGAWSEPARRAADAARGLTGRAPGARAAQLLRGPGV